MLASRITTAEYPLRTVGSAPGVAITKLFSGAFKTFSSPVASIILAPGKAFPNSATVRELPALPWRRFADPQD
jgi:hypothetical protein